MDEIAAALSNLLEWLPADEQLDAVARRHPMVRAEIHADDIRAARAALRAADGDTSAAKIAAADMRTLR